MTTVTTMKKERKKNIAMLYRSRETGRCNGSTVRVMDTYNHHENKKRRYYRTSEPRKTNSPGRTHLETLNDNHDDLIISLRRSSYTSAGCNRATSAHSAGCCVMQWLLSRSHCAFVGKDVGEGREHCDSLLQCNLNMYTHLIKN